MTDREQGRSNAKAQAGPAGEGEGERLPEDVEKAVVIGYRSVGLGVWAAIIRGLGMPLEKIALEANSGRVGSKNQLREAVRRVSEIGWLNTYKFLTVRSFVVWFLQFGAMGLAYQSIDEVLSSTMKCKPQMVGPEAYEHDPNDANATPAENFRWVVKSIVTPLAAAGVETALSNKAEVQRALGKAQAHSVCVDVAKGRAGAVVRRAVGPGFLSLVGRNFVMMNGGFVITPVLYKAMPEQLQSPGNVLFFGLFVNAFMSNPIAVTMQSLWGRTVDFANTNRRVSYREVISGGLRKDGVRAFISPAKWFTRVLMNAPSQGTIPWFANSLLPIWEPSVLRSSARLYHRFNPAS